MAGCEITQRPGRKASSSSSSAAKDLSRGLLKKLLTRQSTDSEPDGDGLPNNFAAHDSGEYLHPSPHYGRDDHRPILALVPRLPRRKLI